MTTLLFVFPWLAGVSGPWGAMGNALLLKNFIVSAWVFIAHGVSKNPLPKWVFVGAGVAATWIAVNPTHNAIGGVVPLAVGALAVLSLRHANRMTAALAMASGAAIAVVATWWLTYATGSPVADTFGNRNPYSAMLLVGASCGLYAGVSGSGWKQMVGLGLFVALASAALATGCRSALLGIGVMIVVGATMSEDAIDVVMLFVVAACLYVIALGVPERLVWENVAESFSARRDIWGIAIDRIAEKPIFGWGPGSFQDSVAGISDVGKTWDGLRLRSAHNDFLHFAAEWGVTGIAVWVWAVSWWVKRVDITARPILAGLAAVVGMGVFNGFIVDASTVMLYAIPAGLAMKGEDNGIQDRYDR